MHTQINDPVMRNYIELGNETEEILYAYAGSGHEAVTSVSVT